MPVAGNGASGLGGAGLTTPAADMRDAILEGARSGKLEGLRTAIELNEIKPLLGGEATGDAIARLAAMAGPAGEAALLGEIGTLLEGRWIALPIGPDHENARVYVWPRMAETGLADMTAEDAAWLERLAGADGLARMRKTGTYDHWCIGIGADGSWHFLARRGGSAARPAGDPPTRSR